MYQSFLNELLEYAHPCCITHFVGCKNQLKLSFCVCFLNATLYLVIYSDLLKIDFPLLTCFFMFAFVISSEETARRFPFSFCNDPKFISFFILFGFVRRECSTLLGGYILTKSLLDCHFLCQLSKFDSYII